MHSNCNTDLEDHTNPRSATCAVYSAGLPLQFLIELQFRELLSIDTRMVQQPIMPGFRCQISRLVKLKFRDCLKPRFQGCQLLAQGVWWRQEKARG